MSNSTLYFGDNLDILRRYVKDETVDLVYLDPPFNSKRDYNIVFGQEAEAQLKAFKDTWNWDNEASLMYEEIVETGGNLSHTIQACRLILGIGDMLAYLTMMVPRLIELRRVLKFDGSIYLHCDPTASHYLKLLMDAVFGEENFRNEIIWKRTPFSGSSKAKAKQLPRSHDTLLFYSKSNKWKWNRPSKPYTEKYLERFKWDDNDGRGAYRKTLLKTFSQDTFERLKSENRLIAPQKEGAMWSYKQYLAESTGETQIDDTWIDINAINPVARERLGWPTQKPEALLERIIRASSNEEDVVLDPFCGCGTATVVAQQLNRKWIGIDITNLATTLIKGRLRDSFGDDITQAYSVIGEPTTVSDAEALAQMNRYQFQYWSLGLVGARPEAQHEKKGADKGIDGRLFFHDEAVGSKTKQIIFSIKSGKPSVTHMRDLRGVIEREKAEIGVLITLEEPTQPMRDEAASSGFYTSAWGKHPRLQILTIEDLLANKQVNYPKTRGSNITFKQAPRQTDESQTLLLPMDTSDD